MVDYPAAAQVETVDRAREVHEGEARLLELVLDRNPFQRRRVEALGLDNPPRL